MSTQRSQLDLFSAGTDPLDHPSSGTPSPAPGVTSRTEGASTSRGQDQDSLEALTGECLGCHRCGLAATRNHVVISRGNPLAQLMLIGKGPGQHEDETGLPFVGRAGQLLD